MKGLFKILLSLIISISSLSFGRWDFWANREKALASKETRTESVVFYAKAHPNSNELIARNAVLTLREGAKATILLMHGFGLDKLDMAPLRLLLTKYNVMTFDFRAHGEKRFGQLSTIGHDEVYDVFGAVDYIKARPDLKDLPLIGFGISMGAATAIEAQALDPNLFVAMFLDTPFSTSDSFMQQLMSGLKFKVFGYEVTFLSDLMQKYAYTAFGQGVIRLYIRLMKGGLGVDTFVKPIYPIESIKKINIPIYLVACKRDEKIPHEGVLKLVEAHPGVTRLAVTGGRRHCDSLFFVPETYKLLLNNFIKDVISGKIYDQPKKEVIEIMVDRLDEHTGTVV